MHYCQVLLVAAAKAQESAWNSYIQAHGHQAGKLHCKCHREVHHRITAHLRRGAKSILGLLALRPKTGNVNTSGIGVVLILLAPSVGKNNA